MTFTCLRAPGEWSLGALVLAAVLAWPLAPSVFAQEATGEDDEAVEETASARDFRDIDKILAQDEEALYTEESSLYDSGGRRDPFRSLLRGNQPDAEVGTRPEGVAGLLVSDLTLEGVFVTPAGPVAQVKAASDEIGYLLRPGDQLWDGDVTDVTVNSIVFKQSVDDPTALKPFREVVMRLNEP